MIEQVAIALFGVTAVLLSQTGSQSTRRWACIFGLIGQPFWFYATYKAAQWGMFTLCIFYSYAWALGLWNNWLRSPFELVATFRRARRVSWWCAAKVYVDIRRKARCYDGTPCVLGHCTEPFVRVPTEGTSTGPI